jgi:hypothetical protein
MPLVAIRRFDSCPGLHTITINSIIMTSKKQYYKSLPPQPPVDPFNELKAVIIAGIITIVLIFAAGYGIYNLVLAL